MPIRVRSSQPSSPGLRSMMTPGSAPCSIRWMVPSPPSQVMALTIETTFTLSWRSAIQRRRSLYRHAPAPCRARRPRPRRRSATGTSRPLPSTVAWLGRKPLATIGALWSRPIFRAGSASLAMGSPQIAAQALSPLQNKLGALLAAPAMRLMLGQATSTLRLAAAMDERKIVIARLPKGLIGEDNTNLTGSLLVNAVQHAAMRRALVPEAERVDFLCYLDEFKNFTTESFADILSELRKYHVGFVMSGQFLAQIRPSVRAAIIGNVGTLVAFQVGHDDAEELAPVFEHPNIDTLTGLNRGEVAIKLTQNGQAQQPFLGYTYTQVGKAYEGRRAVVLEQSHRRWGRPRTL